MITQAELKKLLHYDPSTGIFTKLTTKNRKYKKGSVVGSSSYSRGKTYLCIVLNYKNYKSHRLAWLYMTGQFPSGEIDHLNGNGTDNKWSNLRDVSLQDNHKNRRAPSSNKSGLPGVINRKKQNMWFAYIQNNKKQVNLGTFDDFFEACCARKSAERKYGYHINHGSVRPL